MSPINRKKLEILRKELDKIDNSLIKIIKRRTYLVEEVLKLKKFKNQIVDRRRINKILNRVKRKSKK